MSFNYPTLKELSEQILGDLKEEIADPRFFLPGSPLYGLSYALSGAAFMLHTHIDHVGKYQLLPDTAQGEELERWAHLFEITRAPASTAKGQIGIHPLDDESLKLLKTQSTLEFLSSNGKLYQAQPNGKNYTCLAKESGFESNIAANSKLFSVDKNLKAEIQLVEPGIVGGSPLQSDEELRQTLLFRLKHPPRGGTQSDYILWAKEKSFVGTIWIEPAYQGPGSIGISFLTTDLNTPIPSQENVATLQAHLDLKKPIGTRIDVYAPIEKRITFTIWTETQQFREAIQKSLKQMLFSQPGKPIYRSKIHQILAQTVRDERYELHEPTQDIEFQKGEVGVLGEIRWK